MSRKTKGTNAERELVHLFHSVEGWSAIRVAGSGSSRYPAPDILAGNSIRQIAIECKTCKSDKKYIEKADVYQLKEFAEKFGAEMWIGVRFNNCPWYFVSVRDLIELEKSFVVAKEDMLSEGITFDNLVGKR